MSCRMIFIFISKDSCNCNWAHLQVTSSFIRQGRSRGRGARESDGEGSREWRGVEGSKGEVRGRGSKGDGELRRTKEGSKVWRMGGGGGVRG